ncbi:MAG: GNAT family N-acetyltransferase [Candidatus Bathycorpusculaceae bacterium]
MKSSMTIRIRSFNSKDLPILVKLLNERYADSYEFVPHTVDSLLSRIREDNLTVFVAEEDGEVLGSAAYNDGHWGEEIEWLAVSKIPNQKILKNALISEIEKQVKGEKVFTAVSAESPEISEWIERDYKAEGGLYHMVARLHGLKPLPKIPEGTILRSLKSDEEEKFVEAVNAGFGRERVAVGDIGRWKSGSPPFDEDWIHVAELNNKIVSVVVSRPDTKYNKFFNGKRGYLGPIATLTEHRGKNLASALTCRALNFLYEKGMDSVALYTSEENIPSITFLQKLDFKVGHHWKFMHKKLAKK